MLNVFCYKISIVFYSSMVIKDLGTCTKAAYYLSCIPKMLLVLYLEIEDNLLNQCL